MLFKTFSAAVFGIDAYLVEVEVDVHQTFEGYYSVVGLPDLAVKESRERIRSALRNCGFEFPSQQAVIVNLAPADIRKEGSAFDLPMALGLLGCQGTFFGKILDSYVFLGELSLDGSVRSVRGALSAALAARERGIKNVVVPEVNAREAAVVQGIDIFAVKSLPQAVYLINSPESFRPATVDASQMLAEASQYSVDLRDVRGQMAAKRALQVACPQATTSCSSVPRAREKPCLRSAFRRFFHQCRSRKPLKQRVSIASPGCSMNPAVWSARGRSARRITQSATPA